MVVGVVGVVAKVVTFVHVGKSSESLNELYEYSPWLIARSSRHSDPLAADPLYTAFDAF